MLTPAGTGDQQQLEFGPDGQVRHYRNGRLVSTDTYELRRGLSRLDGQPATLVQYGRGLGQSAILSNSELILRDEAADGQQHVYSR
ncbi:hypothetical protein [Hymenobacter sp. B81]|uniref:hypothetical protein n=1 Tax=Hymenobacter sp. B81 TaxID=3344878 RepID=UPI0037DDA1B1